MNKLLIFLALIAIGYFKTQAENIELTGLDGTNGLTISSLGNADGLAWGAMNYAGDINKDGFDDVLLWTDSTLYLIYGTSGPSEINLTSFNSTQGFKISGASLVSFSGTGDVNGNKIDDLLIGDESFNSVSVIFGSKLGLPNINLTEQGNQTVGITKVSGAGDINNDGLQDMLIAAQFAGLSDRAGAGVVLVIYGNKDGLSNINLTNLNSTQGFSVVGPANNSYLGQGLSKAGDVNGDGIDDFILGSANGFPAYVIYGNANGFADMDLAIFNSTQGFTISAGDQQERVSYAGDVNGDLLDDILIGLYNASTTDNSVSAAAYVLYGSKTMPFNVALSNITPDQGFSILTNQNYTFARAISGLGDFNQDGLDDVIVTAPAYNNNTGAAFVIFGTKSQPASISVDTFPSTQGIAILGADLSEQVTVSGIGDFNGDNVPDIAFGINSDTTSGYVVYSPYKANNNTNSEPLPDANSNPEPLSNANPIPEPLSAGRIGYKAFIMSIVAFILCML